ncbi:MAG: chloride channel protein [Chloroflexi bacterium]|nr:chloride channel protein [Chloroflexota bacterium]
MPLSPHRLFPFAQTALKWGGLGALVGTLAGVASAVFLHALAWATAARLANPWLITFLPLAGLAVGWGYWRFGGRASQGNNLVIDEVNRDQERIPLRMAPLVLVGTIVTHLFGGSAGREGTAIQMGASLADSVRRILPIPPADRRLLIMAGIAGGFGSVFGVPAAGFIFGMEVQTVGRVRYEGLIPCLVAAYTGDWVTRALGAPHSHYPAMPVVGMDGWLVAKVGLAGLICGLVSMVFVELVHAIKEIWRWQGVWPPLQPVLGGVVVVVLAAVVGSADYLGLSLPLIQNSVDGTGVVAGAFALKLLFTAVTLGCGYQGGEVTPLLVMGATLGFTLGRVLGVDPAFMASIGLVAVFAGASNTPLASAVMGIELVGGGSALYLFLACALAYFASGHRGIYNTQPIGSAKAVGADVQEGENLRELATRRRGDEGGISP